MEELRTKSKLLTGYLEYLVKTRFSKSKLDEQRPTVEVITPQDPDQRGCQLSLKFSVPVNLVFEELTKEGVVVSTSSLLSIVGDLHFMCYYVL